MLAACAALPVPANSLPGRRPAVPQPILLLIMGVCAFFLLTGFGPPTLVDDPFTRQVRYTAADLAAIADAQQAPDALTAKAALLYDEISGRVLFAQGADRSLPPASLAKLMTALLVLEHGQLDDVVTVAPGDVVTGSASRMGLNAGEQLTVRDLLWGLLLPSGNDAALALARHTAGSLDAFVETMNRRAAQLGLSHTHFANPHGLDADGQVSSAGDLATLTIQLLKFPLFAEIVASADATVSGRDLQNTNALLTRVEGAVGVKTGTTDAAGECLVGRFDHDGRHLLTVVLGSDDRYGDTEALLALYDQRYTWQRPDPAGLGALDRLFLPDGKIAYLTASGDLPAVLAERGRTQLLQALPRIDPTVLTGTLTAGAIVGQLQWLADGIPAGAQSLVVR